MADYAPKRVRDTSTQIVQNYLDMLLSDVPNFEPEAAATTVATTAVPRAPAAEDSFAAVSVQLEPEPKRKPQPQPKRKPEPEQTPGPQPQISPAAGTAPPAPESSADWRKQDFASLLFDVGGLQLAAPLRHLGGISQLSMPLQTVAGQADWFLGLMRWNGRNIRVIDTARLIMPERVDAVGISEYQSMVVLGDSHWALAANEVIESLTLTPADVKWRKGSAQRPWLNGMLAQRLCVLMDVERLIQMLELHDAS